VNTDGDLLAELVAPSRRGIVARGSLHPDLPVRRSSPADPDRLLRPALRSIDHAGSRW
jgi:hypothetical protein